MIGSNLVLASHSHALAYSAVVAVENEKLNVKYKTTEP